MNTFLPLFTCRRQNRLSLLEWQSHAGREKAFPPTHVTKQLFLLSYGKKSNNLANNQIKLFQWIFTTLKSMASSYNFKLSTTKIREILQHLQHTVRCFKAPPFLINQNVNLLIYNEKHQVSKNTEIGWVSASPSLQEGSYGQQHFKVLVFHICFPPKYLLYPFHSLHHHVHITIMTFKLASKSIGKNTLTSVNTQAYI